jgi:HSP20 family molecular chaperone IbpA/GTPase SAR1 family protein
MSALAHVLRGVPVDGDGKQRWVNFGKVSSSTPYDLVIRINSLAALSTSGWEIVLGQNAKNIDTQISTSEDSRGVIVAVLGAYNRGKSFLLNQLCDIKLPSGNLIYTEGISITAGKSNSENVIFIDTAGTDTAIPKHQLDDKKATEALLREIALHLCSHIMIVVNRLRATDQSYIQQVLMHSINRNCSKNIIIIHNLMDVEKLKDIDEIIKTEVEYLFEAKLDSINLQFNKSSVKVNFFRSTQNGMKLRHFILAKHGSDAAKQWNRQSVDGIMNILQTATDYRRNLDVINEMINFVNSKLPQLFLNNHKQDDDSDENNEYIPQVQHHCKKPCIVLSNRRELDDLEQCPDELILSPKLLYDDAGYFIGIGSINNGQWQPFYDIYESDDELHVIVELAGFRKGEVRIQVIEEAIIIEGRRASFKETLQNPTIHREKIPTGEFRLEIPLPHKVDNGSSKLECDEGFQKIICPKKKVMPTFLR